MLDAADLLRSYRDIEIWIAGGNSRPDVFFERNTGRVLDKLGIVMNNRKRIERIIDKNQLSNVKLLGVVSQPEQLIVKSSVLIFPSYMNGPSRSVFEAGVFSRPSIISLNDKIEDVVKDQITGTIIDEGSPQQIVEAILQLYNDRRKLEEMGGNARIKYLAMNDPYQNIKSIEKIYKLLL